MNNSWEWIGDIDSREEFEFSKCECIRAHQLGFCQYWECKEKGYDKWDNTVGFWFCCVLAFIGSGVACICVFIDLNDSDYCLVMYCIFYGFTLMSLVSVAWGGVAALVVADGMVMLTFLFNFMVHGSKRCTKRIRYKSVNT